MTTDLRSPIRSTLCLNGRWRFAPGTDPAAHLRQPADRFDDVEILVPSAWNGNGFAKAQPLNDGLPGAPTGGDFRQHPEYPLAWDTATCGWYQRTVHVPATWAGQRIELVFHGICGVSSIWLDGLRLADSHEGFLPVTLDLTDRVTPGTEHLIQVGVRTFSSLDGRDQRNDLAITHPSGSIWGMVSGGIWQDVELRCRPIISIRDCFAQPRLDDGVLRVQLEWDGTPTAAHLRLRELDGRIMADLGTHALARSSTGIDCPLSAIPYRLWQPEDPVRYLLDVELHDGDQVADQHSVRFGFRSFAVVDGGFRLNGQPIRLFTDAWHWMGEAYQTPAYARALFAMSKKAGISCIRLHAQPWPEFYLTIADEVGMLIVDETAIWGSHCHYRFDEAMLQRCHQHIAALMRRDRNHPSVIMWNVENECVPAYRLQKPTTEIPDERALARLLHQLADEARRHDDLLPLGADGSDDLEGRLDTWSVHYPHRNKPIDGRGKAITIGEMTSIYYGAPDGVCGYAGEQPLLSWRGRLEATAREASELIAFHRPRVSQISIFNVHWYGNDPLPFSERTSSYADETLPGVKPARRGPLSATLNADDPALPLHQPNAVFAAATDGYLRERLFHRDRTTRFWNGAAASVSVLAINDARDAADYVLRWRIGDGAWQSEGIHLEPTQTRECTCALPLPSTSSLLRATLIIELQRDGRTVHALQRTVMVLDRAWALQRITAVPTAAVGWNLPGSRSISEADVVVVAPGATMPADLRTDQVLIDASLTHAALVGASVEKVFPAPDLAGTVLMADLLDDDLYAWQGELVADRTLRIEHTADRRALLVDGWGTAVVADTRDDNGQRRIISGLDLVQSHDPAALLALGNLVQHAVASRPAVTAPAVLMADSSSSLPAFLSAAGVAWQQHQTGISLTDRTVIIDGSIADLDAVMATVLQARPNHLVCWGLQPDGIPHRLQKCVSLVRREVMQAVRSDDPGIAAGVHAYATYGLVEGSSWPVCRLPMAAHPHLTPRLISTQLDWRTWINQPEQCRPITVAQDLQRCKPTVSVLASTRIDGVPVHCCQLAVDAGRLGLRQAAATIAGALGIRLLAQSGGRIDGLLRDGLVGATVQRCLALTPRQAFDPALSRPAINRRDGGALWLMHDAHTQATATATAFALQVFSPQERTNLLANPDSCGVQVRSQTAASLWLNGVRLQTGVDLRQPTLLLRAGWNSLMIVGEQPMTLPDIRFHRNDGRPIDLSFNLADPDASIIPHSGWTASASHANEDAALAFAGIGQRWDSHDQQAHDVWWQIDLGAVHPLRQLTWDGKVLEISTWLEKSPKHFRLEISSDGSVWNSIYDTAEHDISRLDFAVVLHPDVAARFIRIRCTASFWRSLAIEGFTVAR